MATIVSPHGLTAKLHTSNILLALQSSPEARNQFAAALGNTGKKAAAYNSGNIEQLESTLTSHFTRHHGENSPLMQFATDAAEFNELTTKHNGSSKVRDEKQNSIDARRERITDLKENLAKNKEGMSQDELDKANMKIADTEKQLKPHLHDLKELTADATEAGNKLQNINNKFAKAPPSNRGDKFKTNIQAGGADTAKQWVTRGLDSADRKDIIGEVRGSYDSPELKDTHEKLSALEKNNYQMASNINKDTGGDKQSLENITIEASKNAEPLGESLNFQEKVDMQHEVNTVEVSTWDKIKNTVSNLTKSNKVAPEQTPIQNGGQEEHREPEQPEEPKPTRFQQLKQFVSRVRDYLSTETDYSKVAPADDITETSSVSSEFSQESPEKAGPEKVNSVSNMSQDNLAKLDQQLAGANLSDSFTKSAPAKEESPSQAKTNNIAAAEGHSAGSEQLGV